MSIVSLLSIVSVPVWYYPEVRLARERYCFVALVSSCSVLSRVDDVTEVWSLRIELHGQASVMNVSPVSYTHLTTHIWPSARAGNECAYYCISRCIFIEKYRSCNILLLCLHLFKPSWFYYKIMCHIYVDITWMDITLQRPKTSTRKGWQEVNITS